MINSICFIFVPVCVANATHFPISLVNKRRANIEHVPISFCALYILKCFNFAWNWSLQMLLKEWKWDTCCIDSLYLWERSHEISHPYPFCLHNSVFWVSDFRHWLEDMAHGCVKIKSLMSLNKIPNVTDFIKLFK